MDCFDVGDQSLHDVIGQFQQLAAQSKTGFAGDSEIDVETDASGAQFEADDAAGLRETVDIAYGQYRCLA